MVAGDVHRLVVGRDADVGREAIGILAGHRAAGRAGLRFGRRIRFHVHVVGHRHRLAAAQLHPSHDREGPGIDRHQLVGHHAGDVDHRAGAAPARAVRHVAGGDLGERLHRRRVEHRDGVHIAAVAVEIGVGHVGPGAVGREADRRRKHADARPSDQRVAIGGVLPHGAERRAVGDRDVPVFPVGETATLCGPLISFGTSLTEISRPFFQPEASTSIRVTISAPSLEMYNE